MTKTIEDYLMNINAKNHRHSNCQSDAGTVADGIAAGEHHSLVHFWQSFQPSADKKSSSWMELQIFDPQDALRGRTGFGLSKPAKVLSYFHQNKKSPSAAKENVLFPSEQALPIFVVTSFFTGEDDLTSHVQSPTAPQKLRQTHSKSDISSSSS